MSSKRYIWPVLALVCAALGYSCSPTKPSPPPVASANPPSQSPQTSAPHQKSKEEIALEREQENARLEERKAQLAEERANKKNETNDCACNKLERQEFGVERWELILNKPGYWCTRGFKINEKSDVRVRPFDWHFPENFQALFHGRVIDSTAGPFANNKSINFFSPNEPGIVKFSAAQPTTLLVTITTKPATNE